MHIRFVWGGNVVGLPWHGIESSRRLVLNRQYLPCINSKCIERLSVESVRNILWKLTTLCSQVSTCSPKFQTNKTSSNTYQTWQTCCSLPDISCRLANQFHNLHKLHKLQSPVTHLSRLTLISSPEFEWLAMIRSPKNDPEICSVPDILYVPPRTAL